MSKKEKYICSGYNKPRGMVGKLHSSMYRDYYKCDANATIFEDGKHWCKRHAPSKVKEREEKSWQKYLDRLRKNLKLNS